MVASLHAIPSTGSAQQRPSEATQISEARFHDLLVAGFARIAAKLGKGTFADRIGRTPRALDNILTGSMPSVKVAFDALRADPTALDEVAAQYGVSIVPREQARVEPLETATGLCQAAGALVQAMKDGRIDHLESLQLAAMFRAIVPELNAIISDADQVKFG